MTEYIVQYENDYLQLLPDKMQELIRCKECKHRPMQPEPGKTGFALEFPDSKCPCQCDDGWYSWYPPDDWFCPRGERT